MKTVLPLFALLLSAMALIVTMGFGESTQPGQASTVLSTTPAAVSQSPPSDRDRAIMAVCDRVNTYAAYVVEARHSAIPRSDVLALLEETTGPDNTPHPQKWRQFMRWIVNYVYQEPASDAARVGIQIDMKCIEFAVRSGY